jgi:hypothetical protein
MANKWNKSNRNPYNPESELYRRLTRLLSGPIVNFQTQKPKYGRIDQFIDASKSTFKSASGQQFKKQTYDPFNNLQAMAVANARRNERYLDFDQMEYTPELASALDIYADEITTSNQYQRILKITCQNDEIKEILKTLFYDVLNIESNLFGWARNMCKYGDAFLFLDIEETLGIKSVITLPTSEVERLEGEDKSNPNYVQYQWNSAGLTLENWQVAHFRILGNDKYSPYGSSVLEASRRIWRQLTLLEDAMMAYRIVRSPERRIFYVDVGGIDPADVEQYMEKVMTQMKRHKVVDNDSGRVDLRYNPMSIDEDYYIPVRGGQSTKIESLPGGQFTGAIDDVEYLRDKLFSAIKIPRSYLARGKDSSEDKTTLAQKDIRFARTIQRLQRAVLEQLEKIAIVHLYTLGYKGSDLLSFDLSLNNPSKIAELQELEQWKAKFEVASAATEGYFSKRWVSLNLFNISEDEFKRNQEELFYDKKVAAALEQVSAGGGQEASGGGGGGGLGGLGGGLGGEELPPPEEETPPAPETPAPEAGGGENVLLAAPPEAGAAAPAKRDSKWDDVAYVQYEDGSYETKGSNGKRYTPVKNDKRETAGLGKQLKALGGGSLASKTKRNIAPGHNELMQSARLMENKTNYIDDTERKLFEGKQDILNLIKSLEKKNEDEA